MHDLLNFEDHKKNSDKNWNFFGGNGKGILISFGFCPFFIWGKGLLASLFLFAEIEGLITVT